MSGLEVAAAIASIVSGFTASVTLYRSWRKQKVSRVLNAQNAALERSLASGETSIKQEYDTSLVRLGPRFAIGDDQTRAELSNYVITLQHVIMTLMSESARSGMVVLPSLPAMLSTSDETRSGVVRALGNQYQRMLQSAPIPAMSFISYSGGQAPRALAATPYGGYVIGPVDDDGPDSAEGSQSASDSQASSPSDDGNEPIRRVRVVSRYGGYGYDV